jgi:hypothetical protein
MMNEAHRRGAGVILGFTLGLMYGAVSQFINSFFLPEISFYQPPLGAWGNLAAWIIFGSALGLVMAWATETIAGVMWGSAFCALILLAVNLPSARLTAQNWSGVIVSLLFLSLPMFGLVVPLVAVLRWVVNREMDAFGARASFGRRFNAPIVLLIIVAWLGSIALYAPDARAVIVKMNDLIRAGQQARDPARVPPVLRSDAPSFGTRAIGAYTLEWKNTDLNRYAIPRLPGKPGEEAAVIARFENGWTLVCIFPDAHVEPGCKGF